MKTSGYALAFQHSPRDQANVNEWKIMFDPYIVRHDQTVPCDGDLGITIYLRKWWGHHGYKTFLWALGKLDFFTVLNAAFLEPKECEDPARGLKLFSSLSSPSHSVSTTASPNYSAGPKVNGTPSEFRQCQKCSKYQ